MSGHDRRRASEENGGEPGRDEEVRVDDVRLEAMGRAAHLTREPQVPALASAPTPRYDALDLVPALDESPLDSLDEGPEIRIPGPWIHLRDEQDLHLRGEASA